MFFFVFPILFIAKVKEMDDFKVVRMQSVMEAVHIELLCA